MKNTRIHWLIAIAALLLVAAPAWTLPPPGMQSGDQDGDPPDTTKEVNGGESGGLTLDGDHCTYGSGVDQDERLENFWNCIDDVWVDDPNYTVTPIEVLLQGSFPPVYVQIGIDVGSAGSQEICFAEDHDDMAYVRVYIEEDTSGYIGRIRRLQPPDGTGDLWISINGDDEVTISTVPQGQAPGTMTAAQLNDAVVDALDDNYVIDDTDSNYIHVLETKLEEPITEMTIRTYDTGLVRFELAMEDKLGDYLDPGCTPAP